MASIGPLGGEVTSKYVKVDAESVVLALTPGDAHFLTYLLTRAQEHPHMWTSGANVSVENKTRYMGILGRIRAKLERG